MSSLKVEKSAKLTSISNTSPLTSSSRSLFKGKYKVKKQSLLRNTFFRGGEEFHKEKKEKNDTRNRRRKSKSTKTEDLLYTHSSIDRNSFMEKFGISCARRSSIYFSIRLV